MIPYDPSRQALFHPELQPTVFPSPKPLDESGVCAELSRLAYIRFEQQGEGLSELQQALQRGGLQYATYFHSPATGTQAFAALSPGGAVFLVFRGTQPDDPTDIGTDADLILSPWRTLPEGVSVHSGFAKALDSVWDQIAPWLAAHNGAKLWITGHSLGAALATLAAALCPQAMLVTFGSPRVGNLTFAQSFEEQQVRRFVNCSDIVTMIPPNLIGYKHVGSIRYIDRQGARQSWTEERVFQPIEIDRSIAHLDYIRDHVWKFRNVNSRALADHAPINYVRAFFQ
jgi:pimeloyl-ACP methyl ester carboxylesterase